MATLKERVDKHDREIAAIRKLLHAGAKMLVENEKHIRELRKSQEKTDHLLQDLIRNLNRGEHNGHRDKPIE